MNAFIFVSILCIGQTCNFMTSVDSMPKKDCESIKREFLTIKHDKKITLVAAQCMNFKETGEKV